MIYEPSAVAVIAFFAFVAATMGLSFYLGGKAKSSQGYFAAHGEIPWFINGIAFAGDYLSAASFLGICGMIAFYGYDGFLYSIGYLAGWIVALFVVAEPLKRLGKFTFADALDARFQSRGIKLAVGVSTLAVSIFYLIPQMVGAGVLIQPLLGFPHWVGVVLVGAVVIYIVVSAGMVSTTYVQFLKGSLLVLFSGILTWMILQRGFSTGEDVGYAFRTLGPYASAQVDEELQAATGESLLPLDGEWESSPYLRTRDESTGGVTTWRVEPAGDDEVLLREAQTLIKTDDGETLVNGLPKGTKAGEPELHPVGQLAELPGGVTKTGPVGPLQFFRTLQESEVILWSSEPIRGPDGVTTVYYQKPTAGSEVLRPGRHPAFAGLQSGQIIDKVNFLSLMLALFCGTASLPHILIRYYTVKDEAAARKSTIVGIGSIGLFYILTLYLGLGAMTSGALDPTSSNMAAPLLAKSINEWLFAIISAIAFTTVLGTVSGLILASAGAVTHDLVSNVFRVELNDYEKVRVAKIASVFVGAIAIVLGILFEKMNVSYLVGWAFSVAASANLPALVMLLFWKRTTRQGIIAAVVVGMVSSLAWILLSGDTFSKVYGLPAEDALVPFSQPGIVTIPLGFLTLVLVSLMTPAPADEALAEEAAQEA
ncbi:cation acetate symporter [Maioricimonas sp. JC845]|uniref:sodium/solute symporter n=1 Tax=Maioricimonas sp. JC845 TaxID=3232138 RepID=UPI00345B479B